MLQKKKMTPTIGLKFFIRGSNCDVTIRQNQFSGVILFLAGEDKVGYFLDRPRISETFVTTTRDI